MRDCCLVLAALPCEEQVPAATDACRSLFRLPSRGQLWNVSDCQGLH